MPTSTEMVRHRSVHRQETLRLPHRLESPHLWLPLTSGLMRVLGSVVQPTASAMLNAWHELLTRRSVAQKLVGDHHPRRVTKPLEQLAEEPPGSRGVAPLLDQHIRGLAVLIHCAPQIDQVAVDLAEYVVRVPGITVAAAAPPEVPSVLGPELQRPQAKGLVGDLHAALEHHLLDVSEAKAEAKVQPHANGR